MQPRWALIEKLLAEFESLLAAGVVQLKVEKGIDCPATSRSAQECPTLKRKGVYLIFDEHEVLMYIGSTASQPLFNRVRAQISSKRARWIDVIERARWVDVIQFDEERPYLIPALEYYLIQSAKSAELAGDTRVALVNKVGTSKPYWDHLIEILNLL